MRNGQEKINHKKVFITIIGMVLILLFVVNSSKLLKKTSEKTTVFEGSLSYEEPVEAFVIRDEVVLQGENSENGLVQILADGERAAMNMPIQGSAADIIKLAMIKVHKALKDGGYKSRLILQVHDELLIETYKDEKEAVAKILKENMEQAAELAVPLDVDVHEGVSWFEAK